MASITMTCPSGGNVLVHAGAGSGAAGTICVCGTYTAPPALVLFFLSVFRAIGRFFRRLFGLQLPPPPPPLVTIWVRVVAGGAVANPPLPPIAGDQSTSPNGQNWCVQNMPVPAGTLTGGQLTAYAWLAPAANPPDCTSPFTAGGAGAVDCCSGCGAAGVFFVGELTAHPPLEVAVPDGPNAGRHKAMAVAHRTWVVVIRGVTYRLAGDDGTGLVLRGPSAAESSTSVERTPFSATFPGAVLGSAGEVVVTQA